MNYLKDHILKRYWYSFPVDIEAKYGTSGFRGQFNPSLKAIIFRMGILAAMRSICTKSAIGLMITASHNPHTDNGVKLIDYNGNMFNSEWEKYANTFMCIKELDEMISFVKETIDGYEEYSKCPEVLIGIDNRHHSYELSTIAGLGALCLSSKIVHLNELTTPEMHYEVAYKNKLDRFNDKCVDQVSNNVRYMVHILEQLKNIPFASQIWIDCANGVGGLSLTRFNRYLNDLFKIYLINYNEGLINCECGADYIQKNVELPKGLKKMKDLSGKKFASLDGDADRLIYFFLNRGSSVCILDGDDLIVLFCKFLKDLTIQGNIHETIHVITTNYSNTGLFKYLEENKIKTHITKTGVKHLYEEAKKYHISVFFEANGHGTILVSDQFRKDISNMQSNRYTDLLKLTIELSNPYVGDAIHNIFLVEMILFYYGLDLDKWYHLYNKHYTKQGSVKVSDPSKYICNENESRLKTPQKLQDGIDELIEKNPDSRAFVRPSGTEKLVRVFVESEDKEKCADIYNKIRSLISK